MTNHAQIEDKIAFYSKIKQVKDIIAGTKQAILLEGYGSLKAKAKTEYLKECEEYLFKLQAELYLKHYKDQIEWHISNNT